MYGQIFDMPYWAVGTTESDRYEIEHEDECQLILRQLAQEDYEKEMKMKKNKMYKIPNIINSNKQSA